MFRKTKTNETEKKYQIREIKFDTAAPLNTLDAKTEELTDDFDSLVDSCFYHAACHDKDVKVTALLVKNNVGEWECCRVRLSDAFFDIVRGLNLSMHTLRTLRNLAPYLLELSEGKPIYSQVRIEYYEEFENLIKLFGLKSKLVKSFGRDHINIIKLTADDAEKEEKPNPKNEGALFHIGVMLRGMNLTKKEIDFIEKDVLGPIKKSL